MKRLLLLVVFVLFCVGTGVGQADPITISIPEVTGAFVHGSYYVDGIAGISVPAGQQIQWATLKLLNFRDWTVESNDIHFAFVRSWAGVTGWSTVASPPPANTYGFWDLFNLGTTPQTYGPQAIPAANLPYMTSTFGIAVDPNCHFHGSLELTYETTPIPEPASLLLLGTGLVGLGRAWRKRRR